MNQPASRDEPAYQQAEELPPDEEDSLDDHDLEEPVEDGTRPLVFISYRHGSDQPIVSALKLLFERAITPRPDVFVASEGGIQPSTLGIKSQLQQALQRASAVIGVITQASKDREWLYFEAGAAWGLGKLYAPLLVDTTPTELSTTIAELPATNAHNEDQVRRMLGAIATALGARLRSRFGPKYTSFIRGLRPNVPVRSRVDDTSRAKPDHVAEAVALYLAGEVLEADALAAKLEAQAPNLDEKARIRIWIIMDTKRSSFEKLEQLELLPDEYAHTPSYLFWKAVWDTRSETAFACLQELLANASCDNLMRRLATMELVSRLYAVRRETEATTLLLASFTSADRELRRDAAETWCSYRKSDPPLMLLAIAGFGVRAYPSPALLTRQAQIAIDEGWLALGTYCAQSANELPNIGTTAHDEARAYHKASLWSLAYEAYQKAISLNVSVAKSNIASIAGQHPIAAVGLQILSEHHGAFDSSSPGSPYQIRAELEQAVHSERERRDRLRKNGELLHRLLIDLVELAIRSREVKPRKVYLVEAEQFQTVLNAGGLVLATVQPAIPVAEASATEVTLSLLTPTVVPSTMQSATPVGGLGALVEQLSLQTSSVALRPAQQMVSMAGILAHAAAVSATKNEIVLHSLCDGLPLWEATIKERRHLLSLDETGNLVGFSMMALTLDDPDPLPIRFSGDGCA